MSQEWFRGNDPASCVSCGLPDLLRGAGRGVTATLRRERIHAGGPRLVEYLGVDLPPELSRFSKTAGVLVPWGVLVPPAFGAFLMSVSTVVVAVNAQTLRRVDLVID